MRLRSSVAFFAVALTLAVPAIADAQDRSPESIIRSSGKALPGTATSSPLAYGTLGGDVWFGIEYESNQRADRSKPDGKVSFGFGLFDATKIAGLELSATSFTTLYGFGDRMVMGVKVHKMLAGNLGIAVGADDIALNGDDMPDASIYGAVTKTMTFAGRDLSIGVGAGNGRFQQYEDYIAGETGIGGFASIGLRYNSWLSGVVDYNGQDASVGFRLQPPSDIKVVITPAAYDVLGQAGDKVRFGLGVSVVIW